MKILENKYPLGSIPGQKTAGRYIDETLYENLKPLSQSIQDDMTFLGIIFSSTLENGTGKSALAQQIGEAYTDLVNQHQKTELDFNMRNVVFRPKELIERAFKVPKYSCVILDEWEDLHYWSELGMTLRQFFRKCRQLNLFILIIIPNFFQMPMNYAISRSLFAIDVQFKTEPNKPFARGYFSFYNFKGKKELYIKGKKFQDYNVVKPNFSGRFLDGYAVPDKVYRDAKYYDMIRNDEEKTLTEKEIKVQIFKQLHINLTEISIKRLSEGFGISPRTAYRWLDEEISGREDDSSSDFDDKTPNNIILIDRMDICETKVKEEKEE
jgi:hypothetical protein